MLQKQFELYAEGKRVNTILSDKGSEFENTEVFDVLAALGLCMGLVAEPGSAYAETQSQQLRATQPSTATTCFATSSSEGIPSRAFARGADGETVPVRYPFSRCFPVSLWTCAAPRERERERTSEGAMHRGLWGLQMPSKVSVTHKVAYLIKDSLVIQTQLRERLGRMAPCSAFYVFCNIVWNRSCACALGGRSTSYGGAPGGISSYGGALSRCSIGKETSLKFAAKLL
eukprot:5027909-Amphidinium_carterae.1